MTGYELLERLRMVGTVEHSFRFPYVYVRIVSNDFAGLEASNLSFER